MTSAQPATPWRPLVQQLAYAVDLGSPHDDRTIDQLADAVIRQRVFSSPIAAYYDAAVAALRSGERLAEFGDQDEAGVRDVLSRLVDRLDARRPWPVPAIQRQDPTRWTELTGAPVIARTPASEAQVRRKLNRSFDTVGTAPDQSKILVLELRTGQLVGLRPTGGFADPGVELVAHTDPATTAADFAELTGLELEPA
jgi:hypothetical protein